MSATPSNAPTDSVARAMTNDGGFRVIAACTTATVRETCKAQHASGLARSWLCDLVTGTILIRETMAPTLRVQGILKTRGGSLVADSHPDGGARGLIQRKTQDALAFDSDTTLEMMRTLPNGSLNRGVVSVPVPGGFSTALMEYLQTSEQVVSTIAVGSVWHGDDMIVAGGYVVQLAPDITEGPLMVMTERLAELRSADTLLRQGAATPEAMLAELLHRMPYTLLSKSPVGFKCRCSDVRLLTSLATLPRAEIEEMVRDARPVEIACDYCGQEYRLAPELLRGLLEPS